MRWLSRVGKAGAIVIAVAVVVAFGVHDETTASALRVTPQTTLPDTALGYLGVYTPAMPESTAGLSAFAEKTRTRPNVAAYYSGWLEPFQAGFAEELARRGAVPLVQVDPAGITLSAVVGGRYDAYLSEFAAAVHAFGHPVIISFGHEMNGDWYSWGDGKTSPAVFVAAWRHVVRVFRSAGASNVTWLWAMNTVVGGPGPAASPQPWWPGGGYVNWVGIDGYFYDQSETFGTVFGRSIAAIRRFTRDPVLITETAAAPAAGKANKIQQLFAGARAAGMLGVVWFDDNGNRRWAIDGNPAALTAFGQAAQGFGGAVLPPADVPD